MLLNTWGALNTWIVPQVDEEANSGGFWFRYEQEQYRRQDAKRKRKKAKEKAKEIQSDLDRALALAQREIEEREARDAELERLTKLIKTHRAEVTEINAHIWAMTERAIEKNTFAAMEILDREVRKLHDEEQFLMMAAEIFLNA